MHNSESYLHSFENISVFDRELFAGIKSITTLTKQLKNLKKKESNEKYGF